MKTGEFDVLDELLQDGLELIVLLQQSLQFVVELLFDVLDDEFHYVWHRILKFNLDWIKCVRVGDEVDALAEIGLEVGGVLFVALDAILVFLQNRLHTVAVGFSLALTFKGEQPLLQFAINFRNIEDLILLYFFDLLFQLNFDDFLFFLLNRNHITNFLNDSPAPIDLFAHQKRRYFLQQVGSGLFASQNDV